MNFEPDKIIRAIEEQNSKLPYAGVIHLRQGKETVFKKAYGMANRSDSIPNKVNTRFAMASGSKIFTAAAILQLIDKGLISLDSKLKNCLDIEFPHFDPEVTIFHLFTHSSGIPDYFDEEVDTDYEALWKNRPMYNIRRPSDFLPMFQYEKMKFKPGERFSYSDGGYIVLGLLIEQKSGMEFKEYVQKYIFEPAGMTDSGYFATDSLPARTAYGYIDNDDGSWRANFFAVPIIGAPDGGAYTTIDDLTKFWEALHGGKMFGKRYIEKMIFPHTEAKTEGENHYYGLGVWIIKNDRNISSYYITGWDPGAAMISEIFPDKDLSITLLANSNKPTFPMYRAIREALKV